MVDVLPAELGHVDEAVHAAQVDEGTEVDHRGDDALAALARLEVLQEVAALLLLRLFEPGPARQHDVVAVAVELDDLGLDDLAHVGLQLAHAAQLDERGGQEAAQADVDDQAALDDLDDRTGHHLAVVLLLLDRRPGPLVLRPLLGEDEPALLVLLLEDERLDVVAERHDLGGVDVVADGELAGGDHALGLEADVEQDLVAVDLDDRPLDDVAVVELDDGVAHRLFEIGVPQVVVDDGAGGVVPLGVEAAHRFGGEEGGACCVSHGEAPCGGCDLQPQDRAGVSLDEYGCAAAGAGGQGLPA